MYTVQFLNMKEVVVLFVVVVSVLGSCGGIKSVRIQSSKLKCEARLDQPVCGQFSFKNCIISTCQGDNCQLDTRISTKYQDCMATCCNNGPYLATPYDSFLKCASDNLEEQNQNIIFKVLIIVLAIMAGLICGLIVTGVICHHRRHLNNQVASGDPAGFNPEERHDRKRADSKQNDEQSLNNLFQAIQWKQSEENYFSDYDCVICLGSNPNLQLQCGHSFHPKCFFEWSRKKQECAICRKNDLKELVLRCRKCLKKQIRFQMGFLRGMRRMMQVCEGCVQK